MNQDIDVLRDAKEGMAGSESIKDVEDDTNDDNEDLIDYDED